MISGTSSAQSMSLEGILYPPIEPQHRGFLDVGNGHTVYFEEAGRANGQPVIVLHGGPGSGSSPVAPRFFDPDYFRIISFDQRGCGRSQPLGGLRENTTQHLIEDIEALRAELGVDAWMIYGGSWGATLALAYGISYPHHCVGFLLRSVALGRAEDFRWWTDSMRLFFPEAWESFSRHVSRDEATDLLAAYHSRLSSDDRTVSASAAIEWLRYEGACSSLLPTEPRKLRDATAEQLVGMAKIAAHYFVNNGFLPDGWILRNLGRITHLPVAIVHGRYDIVCPPAAGYELAKAWPAAKLRIVAASGHTFLEPALAAAVVEEADRAKAWLSPCAIGTDRSDQLVQPPIGDGVTVQRKG